MYKQHQEAQAYLNRLKEVWDEALREWKTIEEIKEEISSVCVKCLMPASENCEICLWNTITSDQLYIEFDKLEE